MLRQLTISNYAIVEHLDIDLKGGMTVITGETGAGKSIMLDALGLALGDRADKDVIRGGAESADISACLLVAGNADALEWIAAHDFGPPGDEECLLRRVITREGRSKAYINGRPTTLNELKELGEMLIDIHSQHEHQSLLKTATHQRLLDEFGGLQGLAARVREAAGAWRRLSQALGELRGHAEENNAQLQLLSYQARELDELALGEGELEALEEEHGRLGHAEASLAAVRQVMELCSENDEMNVRQALNHALALLADAPYAGRHAVEANNLLNTALIQVEEAVLELSRAADQVDMNPERLEELDRRLAQIHQVARKHRVAPAALPALHRELQAQLEGMAGSDVKMEAMQKELDALQASWTSAARALSEGRRKAAGKLEGEINAQLARLGMAGARFSLALNSQAGGEPRPGGFDHVEFLVSTNPGQPPKPLIKVASGGELSRISLAIQVVTAQTSAIPTLVFDEVDVGIGGGVARAVGELLRKLGERGQVLCVTHQPQVASQGHQHLYVSKASGKKSTVTQIIELDREGRVREVARMLGGDELTEQSVAHAQEMMAG